MWGQDHWFEFQFTADDGQVFQASDDYDNLDNVLTAYYPGVEAAFTNFNYTKTGIDLEWKVQVDGEMVEHKAQGNVVSVCTAGSVLYSMGYTNEQYGHAEQVKPIIEALYGAFDQAKLAPDFQLRNIYEMTPKTQYSRKLSAVIEFNDNPKTTKSDVLALFDKAILNIRRQS